MPTGWAALFPKAGLIWASTGVHPVTLADWYSGGRLELGLLAILTRPKGPILGAKAEVAPTSPPVHLMYTKIKKTSDY